MNFERPGQVICNDAYLELLIILLSRRTGHFKNALPKLLRRETSIFDIIAILAKFFPSSELLISFKQLETMLYGSLTPLIFYGFRTHQTRALATLQRYLDLTSDI